MGAEMRYANGPLTIYDDRVELDVCPDPPFAPVTDEQQKENWLALARILDDIQRNNPGIRVRHGTGVGWARHFAVTIQRPDPKPGGG
jgi:hypothetical protein